MFLSELARLLFGPGRAETAANRSSYRAVEVLPGQDGCCTAAGSILGKRFLSDEVPMLPLTTCDAESCGCTYKLHADRRRSSSPDRRADRPEELPADGRCSAEHAA